MSRGHSEEYTEAEAIAFGETMRRENGNTRIDLVLGNVPELFYQAPFHQQSR
jgi:hypothetical protein